VRRSLERQIDLICAWSLAKIAQGATAPNGGYARALSHVGSYAMRSGCLRSSLSCAESSTDSSVAGCSNIEGGNNRPPP
jgi:hypothetical protein